MMWMPPRAEIVPAARQPNQITFQHNQITFQQPFSSFGPHIIDFAPITPKSHTKAVSTRTQRAIHGSGGQCNTHQDRRNKSIITNYHPF